MKILVFSDSHGSTMRMIECVEEESPDMIFHLGDCVDDVIDLRSVFPEIPVVSVAGNNDWACNEPLDDVAAVKGTRFFLTHGHGHGIWHGPEKLAKAAKKNDCRFALYGHTHMADCQTIDGVCCINPGSISLPRGGKPSYLRITLESGKEPVPELVELEVQKRARLHDYYKRFKNKT